MTFVRNKLGIFGEDEGQNLKEKSEGGLGDSEEINNQLKKEIRKDKSSLSIVNQSRYLFKMEANVDIKPYHN